MENVELSIDQLVAAAVCPKGQEVNSSQFIRVAKKNGRRDYLTDLQQKIMTAVISMIQAEDNSNSKQTGYALKIDDFLLLSGIFPENADAYLVNEIEKMAKKGLWLQDEQAGTLTRVQWFQSIGFSGQEIVFEPSGQLLALISSLDPGDIAYQLLKGIQYKGKHTLPVFKILWAGRSEGLIEYSIPDLMKALSLEHTRYSYGQLKLRVLEPSLQEIYERDNEIFVRFGPTFSGRRVEGVWFEVTTGKAAEELRKREPEFKFATPEDKPDKREAQLE